MTVALVTLFILVVGTYGPGETPADSERTGCTTDFDCARSGVVGYGVDAALVKEASGRCIQNRSGDRPQGTSPRR